MPRITRGTAPTRLWAGVVAVAAFVLAACGGDEAELRGMVRDEPLQVAGVTLPEIVDAASDPARTQPFTFRAPPGEVLVVFFGFTNCPDLCPTTLAEVRAATRRLDPGDAARVGVVMVTVDPDRDTPERLVQYVSSFSERAHAVRTEDPAALLAAEQAFLASSTVVRDEAGNVTDVAHTATAYVVDDQGRVIVEWPFGFGIDGMAHDLETVLRQVRRA